MVIEAIGIAFLSLWIANEYVYNVYFRIYVDNVFFAHLTTYTVALGLGIGLAGTAVAATFYKTLRESKTKLRSLAPTISGSMARSLASVPATEPKPTLSQTSPLSVSQSRVGSSELSVTSNPSDTSQTGKEKKRTGS